MLLAGLDNWSKSSGPYGYWASVASSNSGQYLVAGQDSSSNSTEYGGTIFISSDGTTTLIINSLIYL